MRFYFQTRSTFHEKRWINLDISHQFQPTTVNDTYVPDRYAVTSIPVIDVLVLSSNDDIFLYDVVRRTQVSIRGSTCVDKV